MQKRYLMQAAAFNLGLVMRKLLAHGTPRALAAAAARLFALLASALVILWGALCTIAAGAWEQRASHAAPASAAEPGSGTLPSWAEPLPPTRRSR